MERGRGRRRDGFFGLGDPFSGLGGFVQPGSLMSSFFGGTNPFDDPFFTNPFGAMMGPSLFEQRMFGSSMFGPHGDLNGAANNAGGFLQQAPEPSKPKGPIIKELSSDDEDEADVNKEDEKKKGDTGKHPRMSKEPYVEEPDEVQDNKRPKHEQFGREYVRASTSRPQPQTFMFQSSTVTYGGSNGACYTSSTTRRTGGDGITVEESKEADTTTSKATHRISRGIGNNGHSLTRKLNGDGKVDTMQTLHNLTEDELAVFEESWQRNAGQNLPGWDSRVNMLGSGTVRSDIRDENQMPALPAPDQSRGSISSRMKMHSRDGSSSGRSRRT